MQFQPLVSSAGVWKGKYDVAGKASAMKLERGGLFDARRECYATTKALAACCNDCFTSAEREKSVTLVKHFQSRNEYFFRQSRTRLEYYEEKKKLAWVICVPMSVTMDSYRATQLRVRVCVRLDKHACVHIGVVACRSEKRVRKNRSIILAFKNTFRMTAGSGEQIEKYTHMRRWNE